MNPLFQGQIGAPYHLSVGAVVVNDQGLVACRHHNQDEHGRPVDGYILVRETIEANETIEEAVLRGIKEELGIEAKILDFLGPVIAHYEYNGRKVEKTNLFFLCQFERFVEIERLDFENSAPLEWHEIDFLIEKQHAQAKQLNRDDINDSVALERVKTILKQ